MVFHALLCEIQALKVLTQVIFSLLKLPGTRDFLPRATFLKSPVARGSRATRILFILGTSRKRWTIWILFMDLYDDLI